MDFTFCHFFFLQVDILKSGNVVSNSFYFYARWNEYGSGKSSGGFKIDFSRVGCSLIFLFWPRMADFFSGIVGKFSEIHFEYIFMPK